MSNQGTGVASVGASNWWRAVVVAAVAVTAAFGPAGTASAHDGYRVVWGDTLSGLAGRLGVGQASLASTNGIANPDRILAGQVLRVPGGSARPSAPTPVPALAPAAAPAARVTGSGTYRVRPGDTLFAVAPRVGLSPRRLAAANNLPDPNRIVSGQVLVVPGRTGGTTAATAASGPTPPAGPRAATAASGPTPPAGPTVASGPTPPTGWRCPVPGARFVNDYGYVKPTGQRHAGVDLFAPRGTPVLAPVSGVAIAVSNPMGGKAFSLEGDDGNRYYGAHLDRYGRTGRVAAGAVIGYVGNTGDARGTSYHLHFELHPRGGADASPYHRLTAAC